MLIFGIDILPRGDVDGRQMTGTKDRRRRRRGRSRGSRGHGHGSRQPRCGHAQVDRRHDGSRPRSPVGLAPRPRCSPVDRRRRSCLVAGARNAPVDDRSAPGRQSSHGPYYRPCGSPMRAVWRTSRTIAPKRWKRRTHRTARPSGSATARWPPHDRRRSVQVLLQRACEEIQKAGFTEL
jgi:hypothetical protein